MEMFQIDADKIDWPLLRKQKRALNQILKKGPGRKTIARSFPHIEGIISILDHIQDRAALVLGEESVFGRTKSKNWLISKTCVVNGPYSEDAANWIRDNGEKNQCGDGAISFIIQLSSFESSETPEEIKTELKVPLGKGISWFEFFDVD